MCKLVTRIQTALQQVRPSGFAWAGINMNGDESTGFNADFSAQLVGYEHWSIMAAGPAQQSWAAIEIGYKPKLDEQELPIAKLDAETGRVSFEIEWFLMLHRPDGAQEQIGDFESLEQILAALVELAQRLAEEDGKPRSQAA
ncbi:hypothetical protein JNK13_11880 [bacterium]|nr:hypothetical protein [bacterium]